MPRQISAAGCALGLVLVLASGCVSMNRDGGTEPKPESDASAATAAPEAAETPAADGPAEPTAARKPHRLEQHGHERIDDYYWLKERESPEVLEYLERENAYVEAQMADTEALQEELFEEMKGRIEPDESSVPYELDGFFYYSRYEEGGEYPIYCRKQGSLEADEEILLDVNKLAEGHEHVRVVGVKASPDHDVLAYAIDTVGRRLYTLKFRDLATGEDLPDAIQNVTGNSAWAADNRTLFYTQQDPETLRWARIYRHVLGTDRAEDVLVYEEDDEEFNAWVWKTKSRKYVMLASEQTLSSEYRYLPADEPEGEFRIFLPREPNHEYAIEDFGSEFFIRTNWEATNFRLMKAPIGSASKDDWAEVLPHRTDVYLGGFEIFRDFLVVSERSQGLIQMRVRPWDGSQEHYLDFGEQAYDAYFDNNVTFETNLLRFSYESMTTPPSVFDYDMTTREKTLRKQDKVLGGFDAADYRAERLWAEARDGVSVPVSVVYPKDFPKDGSGPLLLYGYGSYGASIDPGFSPSRLSLLDRGFAFAIAHVRGGQILGRQWYEDGKLMRKKNTFNDFVDVGKFLAEEGYTSPERLFAMGGSAGGLLMGAVANAAPELFRGIVSQVPFVDVVTTMLDPDIPLTTSEYDEWGDPNEKEAYEYILSYSPYDQLAAKDYPAMLITTGLHDSQVQYWEPAKFVAKLRSLRTNDDLLLLKTNMEAGHSGASGRFKRYRDRALEYAFLLKLAREAAPGPVAEGSGE